MGVKDEAKNIEDLTPYGEFFPYATKIKSRGYYTPFKRHRTLGHAKNALNLGRELHQYQRDWRPDPDDFKLYKWQEDKWVEIS